MSRTKKGTKPPGYEYWARRYMSMAEPGSEMKTITRPADGWCHRLRQLADGHTVWTHRVLDHRDGIPRPARISEPMNANQKEFWVFAVLIVAFVAIAGYFVIRGSKKNFDKCSAVGGVVVRTPTGTVCAKLEVIKL